MYSVDGQDCEEDSGVTNAKASSVAQPCHVLCKFLAHNSDVDLCHDRNTVLCIPSRFGVIASAHLLA